MSSTADARLLTTSATTAALDPLPLASGSVVAGDPAAGLRPLTTLGAVEIGVWELTAGAVTDVEADEVFVVLAGRGTVTFDDGSVVTLLPGTAVRLRAGDRTRWDVSETLRKVYVT